jgi:hypothetical protein
VASRAGQKLPLPACFDLARVLKKLPVDEAGDGSDRMKAGL